MDRFAELAAFVRSVDRGSQAAAARELGVTPAMVGRYIRALEDRLGERLLNRTTATQSLTEAGALLHPRAAAVLEALEAAEDIIADRQAAPRGLLRVSAPMVFGARYVAGPLAGFCNRYPGLRVELSLNDRVVDLVEEGYDVALRIGQLAETSLIARRLATCRLVICASPDYLARHGAPATPEALRRHNCLIYAYAASGTTWRFTGPDGRAVSVAVGGALVANNGDALHEAALCGAGVALQPTFIVGDALRRGSMVRLLPEWRLPELAIAAVYPSSRHLAPKVRGFVDFLGERFAGPPAWDAML